jgi:hypothetical protein
LLECQKRIFLDALLLCVEKTSKESNNYIQTTGANRIHIQDHDRAHRHCKAGGDHVLEISCTYVNKINKKN